MRIDLLCKMIDQTLLRWPTSLQDLSLTIRDLTFCVAFNKTLRASKVSEANKAGQVSHPVQAKLAGAWGLVQADCTVQK